MLMMGVNIDNVHSQQQLGKWYDINGRIFINILSYKIISNIINNNDI